MRRAFVLAFICMLAPCAAFAQSLPWSPIDASVLRAWAPRLGVVPPATTLMLDAGRVAALPDAQSAACRLASLRPAAAWSLGVSWTGVAAGRSTQWECSYARAWGSAVVVEAELSATRVTAREWTTRVHPAARTRLVVSRLPRRIGAWCGVQSPHGTGDEDDGVESGAWWGAPDGAQIAAACCVSPWRHAWSVSCVAAAPLGESVRALWAVSTDPAAMALGVDVARGRLRLACQRVVTGSFGDGLRASWGWAW